MRIILCEKGTLRHLSAQMEISAATRSVYVLCKAPNVVTYILHRQACCDLRHLQVLKKSKCCHLQYSQALKSFKC